MGMQLVLLVIQLCILHGSAGPSISPSAAIFPSVPSIEEGAPDLAHHLKSFRNNTPSVSPLPDGPGLPAPKASPSHKPAPVPRTIEVLVPSMPLNPPMVGPTHKSAPLMQPVPDLVPPMPQSVPDIHPPISVPHSQVPVASPPRKSPEMPLPGHPEPEVAPTASDTVPTISAPPPSANSNEYRIPVAAPPEETSKSNHPPAKEHAVSRNASPPLEKPVAVHPSKPGVAPSAPSDHEKPPLSNSPPSTSTKDNRIPLAPSPKETFERLSPVSHHPIKDHAVSPISTPPSTSRKEYGKPTAPPPKDMARQLPPSSHSPKKEYAMSPKATSSPNIIKKEYGIPVAAPPMQTIDKLSPMTNSPTKGPFPDVASSPSTASRPYDIVPAPSIIAPKHGKKKLVPSPASIPSISFNMHHHARKRVLTPAPAPSYSDVPPTSKHQGPFIHSAPHTPTSAPNKSPVGPFAPIHPPTEEPKKSRPRHHYHPPLVHGPVSQDTPTPSPSLTISSARNKRPVLHPPLAPPPRNPKMLPPPPVQALPPPPPNRDCTSLACSEPFTNSPPGAPCGCVFPIKVELRLGVALYTFFPLVSELALEIATGVFMKQSQVRIMGANAASQQLEKTDVLIDLVPLGDKFDYTTAFLTYVRFWNKQVAINTSFFGDYEVLSVSFPGLPPSPPSSTSITIIDGVPYARSGNNARNIHPLGVDVRRKQDRGLSGSIIAIIIFSSFAALVLCIGAAWLFLLKRGNHTHLVEKTPRTSTPSLAKQSGAAGSTMFGSGISSKSLSFGSSITAYTGTAKTFSADEIERATDNFENSRILGEGGFGRVYKGILEDGKEVAVKVLKRDDQQGGREFLAEVEMLSRLHHRNLVKLIGICIEDHSRCLVYELIPNGSVESHLHGVDKETAPLDWGARMKIALGAARGLAYLHEDSSPHVIHRDFKSSNILLEHDFTPKVSDFGLAKSALEEGNEHISTRVMGTFGYVAPEYAMTGHLLVKSDVYSYGVVLLELLTGRKPVDMSQPEGQENLVAWARPLLTSKEGLEIVIDPSLRSSFPFDSLAKVAAIASMCVQPEVSHRPFMGEVVQALKLVCDECEETKEAGSESCSQEYMSVVDIDTRANTGSGHLLGASHARGSEYDSSPEVDRALSASDIFSRSGRYGRQSSGSFRRHSSSGPLRTGGSRQFWQRVRGLSRGSVSEHGFAYRLWRESS
ncbi:Receptor-like serine/threonine-protein kinase ALE2 [Thalictrum thalictroides]|uniref:Receptor-like serine/threonine-protein kinase ALE2 n=1 Tax=Thalictrum thalictroides TaxID=46969 RepID=A0A7J6WC12_THATH|nr:Receptor-like serine/threonine-protein kinase ALE2 [Thalictrum thalictroides]